MEIIINNLTLPYAARSRFFSTRNPLFSGAPRPRQTSLARPALKIPASESCACLRYDGKTMVRTLSDKET